MNTPKQLFKKYKAIFYNQKLFNSYDLNNTSDRFLMNRGQT